MTASRKPKTSTSTSEQSFNRMKFNRLNKFIWLLFGLFLFSLPVLAHDYWLRPGKFFLRSGEVTPFRMFVGSNLIIEEERGFQVKKTLDFRLFSNDSIVDLKPPIKEGTMPIYDFSAKKSGNYLLAIERDFSDIALDAEKFEEYLKEEGLDYIIEERRRRGETNSFGIERYYRFIKSLVQVGDKQDATYKKKVGLKLEIIPLQNPYSKKPGDTIKFQVFFEGKPLTEKTIFAYNENDNNVSTQKTLTDKNGEFSFKLNRSGFWLIRLVVMKRCETNCKDTEWESFWGSFSFGMK